MTDEPRNDDLRAGEESLAALARAPEAAADFRAQLRRDFAHGAFAGPAPGTAPRVLELPRRRAWTAWGWGLAAAAALVAVALAGLNPGPAWRVTHATGEVPLVIDGRPVLARDAEALSAALVPGARVIVPAGDALEIASAGNLAIQMAPGTEARVPRVPGRWFARRVRGEITTGEWRISTGADFAGARFAIVTPQAHVEVTGTTLAVICEPKGTCVCVYEGHVQVGRGPDDMKNVEHGRRRYVYADTTREPLDDAMLPHERPALGGFCESMRPLLRRPR